MILQGDVRKVLDGLDDESVHCCITSPPYWGLRDYGTASWEGGDPTCDHDQRRRENDPDSKSATSVGQSRDSVAGREHCRKCGARRVDDQIGLEATPEAYVETMVEVFREVRRVLRKDGTLWLNLGDSYWAIRPQNGFSGWAGKHSTLEQKRCGGPPHPIIKPKDLVGIPWMVAFALRSDGWYLRQDIIWAKPNPMPESVTDRCTKAHEYIFMFSRASRYHYDADAIREPHKTADLPDYNADEHKRPENRNRRGILDGRVSTVAVCGNPLGRNKRSVWTIPTQPYPKAHFATFPEKLVEPCILAGCPKGGIVLDPFMGSGTTGKVAERFGRKFVGIELNSDYIDLAQRRLNHVQSELFT